MLIKVLSIKTGGDLKERLGKYRMMKESEFEEHREEIENQISEGFEDVTKYAIFVGEKGLGLRVKLYSLPNHNSLPQRSVSGYMSFVAYIHEFPGWIRIR